MAMYWGFAWSFEGPNESAGTSRNYFAGKMGARDSVPAMMPRAPGSGAPSAAAAIFPLGAHHLICPLSVCEIEDEEVCCARPNGDLRKFRQALTSSKLPPEIFACMGIPLTIPSSPLLCTTITLDCRVGWRYGPCSGSWLSCAPTSCARSSRAISSTRSTRATTTPSSRSLAPLRPGRCGRRQNKLRVWSCSYVGAPRACFERKWRAAHQAYPLLATPVMALCETRTAAALIWTGIWATAAAAKILCAENGHRSALRGISLGGFAGVPYALNLGQCFSVFNSRSRCRFVAWACCDALQSEPEPEPLPSLFYTALGLLCAWACCGRVVLHCSQSQSKSPPLSTALCLLCA
jgi:hypothetical protein